MDAIDILNKAELTKGDFKNDAVYETIINNINNLIKMSKADATIFYVSEKHKNKSNTPTMYNADEVIEWMDKYQQKIEGEMINKTMKVYKIFGIKILTIISCHTQAGMV